MMPKCRAVGYAAAAVRAHGGYCEWCARFQARLSQWYEWGGSDMQFRITTLPTDHLSIWRRERAEQPRLDGK